MGTRDRARQSASHERFRNVHVGQFVTDLQHHDGVHAVQGADHGVDQYPTDVSKVGWRSVVAAWQSVLGLFFTRY